MENNTTVPMNLSKDEKAVIGLLKIKGLNPNLVTRRSDKPFDLEMTGKMQDGTAFSAWVPLSCISSLTDWPRWEIAAMSDYPDMVRDGDWSGIRDSSEDKIWAIFEKFCLPLVTASVPKDTKYEVKNVKSFMGREGYGYEVTLYRNGKKVGRVVDTADGGQPDYYLDKGEKEILDIYCMQLPLEPIDDDEEEWVKKMHPNGRDVDADTFMARLVDDYETAKKFRRVCKTKTLYILKDDPEAVWEIKTTFSPIMAARLRARHGDNLKEIINERFA